MKRLLFFLLLSQLTTHCKRHKTDSGHTSVVSGDSIRIFAQSRPGGEAHYFNMAIDKGLDKLEIAEPASIALEDDELVLGISFDETPMAVPIKYLSGFEVANLRMASDMYLLTWCPLVGTARVFEGDVQGDRSGFDFGRGLKDNNLLLVDRKTKSAWNQLSSTAIEGDLKGERLAPYPSIQSTWAFWKKKYPDTKVVINRDTTNAAFPKEVLLKPYYTERIPGKKSEYTANHQIKHLGLGIELDRTAIFFPLEKLFEGNSPLTYKVADRELVVHFDPVGLTAWAETTKGTLISGTLVYDWAWTNFYPTTIIYPFEANGDRN